MITRKYILGSEWGYCKIYTGAKNADMLLVDIIYPLMSNLEEEELIDKWFYIRYVDSTFHIRLRFHLKDSNKLGNIIYRIYCKINTCIQNRSVSSLVYDTYSREVERYGEENYDETETLFYYDSKYLLEIIQATLKYPYDDSFRWRIALAMTNDLFDVIGMDLYERLLFSERARNEFRREFGFMNKSTIEQFNRKARKYRKLIESSVSKNGFTVEVNQLLDKRKIDISMLLAPLRNIQARRNEYYIGSIIHMTINRLFISSNRLYEMMIYDFLYRYYKSLLNRKISQ